MSLSAAALWGGEGDSLELIADSTNHVFRFLRGGAPFYLRLTPLDHRSREQVEAELDFVLYLHAAGLSVSAPVPSRRGMLIEEVRRGRQPFHASVFTQAPGTVFHMGTAGDHAAHFRQRGRTLGALHALSKRYAPSTKARRPRWDEDALLCDAAQYVPDADRVFWAEYESLRARLAELPTDGDSFGLIHGDFGPTNFRCLGDSLTVFDFDDCCYHWFAYDIAVSAYPHGGRSDRAVLLRAMLEGYGEVASLDDRWRAEFTDLCRLRVLYMYLVYARRWGFMQLTDRQANWFAEKLAVMRRPVVWQV